MELLKILLYLLILKSKTPFCKQSICLTKLFYDQTKAASTANATAAFPSTSHSRCPREQPQQQPAESFSISRLSPTSTSSGHLVVALLSEPCLHRAARPPRDAASSSQLRRGGRLLLHPEEPARRHADHLSSAAAKVQQVVATIPPQAAAAASSSSATATAAAAAAGEISQSSAT